MSFGQTDVSGYKESEYVLAMRMEYKEKSKVVNLIM